MSEQNLISPLLDNIIVGDPFNERSGIRSCPAMDKETEDKYIVKIISTPATSSQIDAMLLSGAFSDIDSALAYFKELTTGIEDECTLLEKLSQLGGFLALTGVQTVIGSDNTGFDTYLLSPYRRTLERALQKEPLTHLAAINLGLDICAALSVCRRSGYLYVALKPENIILTDEGTYKIGDIGFLPLKSLQYASLPDRCRSQYTAPEITDAFSSLNVTLDIYALGLILYRVFNGGNLPALDNIEQLPAPDYADYEMSEIILKACATNPAERWQDPVEFGQALVSYMQRNGAHDTPIIPPAVEAAEPEECNETETATDAENCEETVTEDVPVEANTDIADTAQGEITFEHEQLAYSEDASGNLTFLSDDETLPDEEIMQIEYDTVSQEVSDILIQADDLISHETPAPVIPPEPIDVPVPEQLILDDAEEPSEPKNQDEVQEINITAEEESVESNSSEESTIEANDEYDSEAEDGTQVAKKSHWLRNLLLVLLTLGLLVVGFFFYKYYYIQTIDALELEGSEDMLSVSVTSELDESRLSVVCTDIYGNHTIAQIKNGKATFQNLAPNSTYKINVKMSGIHSLIGQTTASYTSPSRTEIVQLSAVTGAEDGSVILGFTIEGQDSDQWKVTYVTAGEATKTMEFSGHIATINGLTIGSVYTFDLEPINDIYYTGTTRIEHTASTLIRAEDLRIRGCINGVLSVAWSAPENTSVSSWTVHCYNDSGYDKTLTTDATLAEFTDVTDTDSYTVEVTASGMSVSQRTHMDSNSVTALNFSVNEINSNQLSVQWEFANPEFQEELILQYSIDGSAVKQVTCNGNSAVISPRIPDSTYHFNLQTADGISILGGNEKFTTTPAEKFDNYGVIYDKLEFMMCRTPNSSDWNRYYLDDSDYTTSFAVGEKASFLVRIRSEYDTSWDEITTLYVIRDSKGNLVSAESEVSSWTYMWYRNYGEFDIPSLPNTPGEYNIAVYFNGALAGKVDFTVNN